MPRKLGAALVVSVVVLVGLIPPVGVTLVRGMSLLATGQLAQFRHYLDSLGAWAPVVSIALMLVEALAVPVPVTIVMVANGLIFGLWRGMLVSLVGGFAGALAAYTIGRHFGRALVERLLSKPTVRAADRVMARYGAWAVVLERWIPGVPGDPVSYLAGVARMPVPSFLWLTTVGLLPANLVTAYLGSRAIAVGDVPIRYWVSGLLLVSAVWLGWHAVRRRRSRA